MVELLPLPAVPRSEVEPNVQTTGRSGPLSVRILLGMPGADLTSVRGIGRWLVVVDSSVIERAQGNLSNNEWVPLIRAATLGYCSFAIPAVVLAEVVAHRKRTLKKQRNDLKRGVRTGRRSVEDLDELRALLDEHDDGLQRLADAYGDQVLSTCGQAASVLPYPSVRHEELVTRVLAYRRPFNESERGYRDALIWYSVLEKAADVRVVVLTGDTKDFADTNGQLGPDLLADVDRLGLDPEDVRLARNVAEALEIVRPASELFPDADSTWKAWLLGVNGLSVLNEILDRWQGVPIWSIPDDIPPEVWDVGLLGVQYVLNVEHATTLPSADPEISNASAVVTAEGVISGWEWLAFPSSLGGSLWTEGSVADLFRYDSTSRGAVRDLGAAPALRGIDRRVPVGCSIRGRTSSGRPRASCSPNAGYGDTAESGGRRRLDRRGPD